MLPITERDSFLIIEDEVMSSQYALTTFNNILRFLDATLIEIERLNASVMRYSAATLPTYLGNLQNQFQGRYIADAVYWRMYTLNQQHNNWTNRKSKRQSKRYKNGG
jgi:hypothetical protein